jgi:hypothetical protein
MNTGIKKNACEVCNEKPARATIYEHKTKDKEHKHPILHYSCLNHVLDLSNKIEHRLVVISNY